MDYDEDKVDEAVFALLSLTLHDINPYGAPAWKGHDWDVLDRLHQKGLIGDPKSKAKSVTLSSEAVAQAEEAFQRQFGKAP